jgi:hypothetical protein
MNYFLDQIRNNKKLIYLIFNVKKMKLFLNNLFAILKIIIIICNFNNLKKKEDIFLEKNLNNKQELL